MIKIAIIGFGVVGGGITSVIEKNAKAIEEYLGDKVDVKYILDLREFPDSPYGDRVVHDISTIVEDKEISIVCETMGGVNPAFDFSMQCLKSGKSVVTSNKELVSHKGIELLDCARENGVSYLYEAAVGGGIPEIRSMRTSLAAETITKIDGIVNGTTNYILTRMKREGVDFDSTLKDAQKLGYAEKDPTADVDGLDAQRKIMILTAIATNYLADESEVYCETMKNLTPEDVAAAEKWGGSIKVVASARISDENAALYVCPQFVPYSSPLSHVNDVYNAIRVESPVSGDVMFYGRGAGRMPTAGAVVSDVVSAASGLSQKEKPSLWKKAPEGYVVPFEYIEFSYYVRLRAEDADKVPADSVDIVGAKANIITKKMAEKDARALFAKLSPESVIRVLE